MERLVCLWNSVNLVALQPQLSEGLKRTYDFVDYLAFSHYYVGSYFFCTFIHSKPIPHILCARHCSRASDGGQTVVISSLYSIEGRQVFIVLYCIF